MCAGVAGGGGWNDGFLDGWRGIGSKVKTGEDGEDSGDDIGEDRVEMVDGDTGVTISGPE